MKLTYTLRNIRFATKRDQKQKTNLFLLSLTALSIYTFSMGRNGFTGIGISGIGPSGSKHISTIHKSAAYKGWDGCLGNSCRDEDFGGASRSCNSSANKPTV